MPVALIADLVGSRHVQDRLAHQDLLDGCLAAVAEWAPAGGWIAPLERVKGIDELAGALESPASVFDLAVAVNLAVWPQRYRWGVGQGEIDVPAGAASHLDGPAFWNAAKAMARARDAGVLFAVELGHDPASERLLETTARLHAGLVRSWTEKGAQTVRLYRELGRQDLVAERLGISQQAVSSRLVAAHWAELEEAERVIGDWLSEREPRPATAAGPEPPPIRPLERPPTQK